MDVLRGLYPGFVRVLPTPGSGGDPEFGPGAVQQRCEAGGERKIAVVDALDDAARRIDALRASGTALASGPGDPTRRRDGARAVHRALDRVDRMLQAGASDVVRATELLSEVRDVLDAAEAAVDRATERTM